MELSNKTFMSIHVCAAYHCVQPLEQLRWHGIEPVFAPLKRRRQATKNDGLPYGVAPKPPRTG
jgi:hypothetical protein